MGTEKIYGKKKLLAPVLSVAMVGICTMTSLSGYQAPVYTVEAEEVSDVEEIKTEVTPEAAPAKGTFELADGVYEGTGVGFAGKIKVSVEIKDGSIMKIDVLSSSDDTSFLNRAKGVIEKMIQSQSLDVDTVSGATYSSKGIMNAVKNALTGEKDTSKAGNTQSSSGTSSSAPSVGTVVVASAYKDGTYYGTGTGFGGKIKVEVTISGGKIASIRIMQHSDGSSYVSSASAVINRILSKQSTNVDTVSGATYSSAGIIQAVRNALGQAAVDEDNTEQNGIGEGAADTTSEITGTVLYDNGIYFGTAEGYMGDITVAVVIQDKTIKEILVTEHSDDEEFFKRALGVAETVLKQQNTEVDVVSGATYSSQGLLDAIKNALLEAEKVTNGEIMAILQNTIEEAELLKEEDYTADSWEILQIRLKDAKEALDFEVQKYAEIAANRLRAAIDALVSSDDAFGDGEMGDMEDGGSIEDGDSKDDGETEDGNGKGGGDTEDGDIKDDGSTGDSDSKDDGSSEGSDEIEIPLTKYVDGVYEASAICVPDEYEDFESYNLFLKVTVENDKIIAVTNVVGDGGPENDSYITRAAKGTSKLAGVITQIVEKGAVEEIDVVSRATCSSKSIIEACEKALESALRK